MSTIKLIATIFIFSINMIFSQENNEFKRNSIYLNLNDKALESYKIDKDTMNAHFSIYLKKYDSKKERDIVTKIYDTKVLKQAERILAM
jgi:K+ transporter